MLRARSSLGLTRGISKFPGHTLNPNHVRPAILPFESTFCSLVYSALTRALYGLASTWPLRHLWSPWATKVMHGPQHEAQTTSFDASEHVCTPVELAATRGDGGTRNPELCGALLSPRSVEKDFLDQEKASGTSNGSSGSDHLSVRHLLSLDGSSLIFDPQSG